MMSIMAFFAIIGIEQDGFSSSSYFFISLLCFLLISAIAEFSISMDLLIDEGGIHRVFLGRSVLYLRWSDIKMIKDVVKKSLAGRSIRSFYVVPNNKASLRFWPGRWIRFADNMKDFHGFVDVMNKQIKLHNIRIEITRGVNTMLRNEISVGDN